MVKNLIAALRDDLATLPWMGPETRKAALAKLDAFTPKIGYPDKWRDYSPYKVERGVPPRQRHERRALRASPRHGQDRQAGGPHGVGHDAADGQRLLQRLPKRDRVPGRDPGAPVLRRKSGRRRQLRRDRRRHRPRDDARVRRPGKQVRRAGEPEELVDGGRPEELHGTRDLRGEAVRRLCRGRRSAPERQARPGRVDRGPGRPDDRLQGLREEPRGQAAAAPTSTGSRRSSASS